MQVYQYISNSFYTVMFNELIYLFKMTLKRK